MVLQCSQLFYSKVSSGFLWQNLQSSYSSGKIQNVGGPELSVEKTFSVSSETDFIIFLVINCWLTDLKSVDSTSFRPFLYDQKCTAMYMEIFMTHNIKNYENLWGLTLYSLAMQTCKYLPLNFTQHVSQIFIFCRWYITKRAFIEVISFKNTLK